MEAWLIIAASMAGGIALAIIAITYMPAVIIKRFHLRQLSTRIRGKLALTFDDGPGAELTPRLIELLRRHNVRASFFLVGFRARNAPQVCDELRAAGHELGCHTHMHKKPWRVLPWATAADVQDGYASMNPWLARDAPFRPPFGKLTTWSWLVARMHGAPICFWTADSGDTHPQLSDPEAVAKRIIDRGGAVVLLHNHDRGQDRAEYVLAITDHLLRLAKARGLEVCTMAAIMNSRPGAQRQPFITPNRACRSHVG